MKHALCLGIAAAVLASAQPPSGYLDVYMVKVKTEKRPEFDALAKRLAEANRKHNGDNWVCSEVIYGEQNTLYFTSARTDFAAVDAGMGAFMGALEKAFGPAAMKTMEEWGRYTASSRGEIRRFRLDLSSGVSGMDGIFAAVGKSTMIRSAVVRVRPGRVASFEEQLKMTQAAGGALRLITQSVIGTNATTFYITSFGKTFADLDLPTVPQMLGARYADYSRLSSENILSIETMVSRYIPELSNPPAPVVNANPDFWTPKPKPAPAKPKPANN